MSEADLDKPEDQPMDTSTPHADDSQNPKAGTETARVIPVTDGSASDAPPLDPAAPESPTPGPAELAQQLEAANNRVLRAQAELENFRKRTRRELDEQRRYANFDLLNDLLPVLDNLDRAVEAAEQAESASGLLEGVKMVSAHMLAVLEQHGCRPIEAHGVAFDPNLHEAIGKEASTESAEGIVTRVTRAGYQLHDRVVRPPQVLISSGMPADD